MSVLIDSFDISNYLYLEEIHGASDTGDPYSDNSIRGECFTCTAPMLISSAKFVLRKKSTPTGYMRAKLYSLASGTFGTDAIPGELLATSEDINVSVLTDEAQLIEFSFNGSYLMESDTNYGIAFEYTGGTYTEEWGMFLWDNCVYFGYGSDSYHGNTFVIQPPPDNWYGGHYYVACFYVYGDLVLSISPSVSPSISPSLSPSPSASVSPSVSISRSPSSSVSPSSSPSSSESLSPSPSVGTASFSPSPSLSPSPSVGTASPSRSPSLSPSPSSSNSRSISASPSPSSSVSPSSSPSVAADEVLDSYNETNQDYFEPVSTQHNAYVGQSFTPNKSAILKSVKLNLAKVGTLAGTMKIYLYPLVGTYGINSRPPKIEGVYLAISDSVSASTLTDAFQLIEFTFSDSYRLLDLNHYGICLKYYNGDTSNYIKIGGDSSSPTHSGNYFYRDQEYTNWIAGYSDIDLCFYVYGIQNSVSPSASTSFPPSLSPSATPSASPSVTPSASPSVTPSASESLSPSVTPSPTPSVTPSASPSIGTGKDLVIIDSNENHTSPVETFIPFGPYAYHAGEPNLPKIGQSFIGNGSYIDSVLLRLKTIGSPTGNVVLKIYKHSGTYGTTGIPSNKLMAVSEVIPMDELDPGLVDVTFVFTGLNRMILIDGFHYFLVIEYLDSTYDNTIACESTVDLHDGNVAKYFIDFGNVWYPDNIDLFFIVYGYSVVSVSASPSRSPSLSQSPSSSTSPSYSVSLSPSASQSPSSSISPSPSLSPSPSSSESPSPSASQSPSSSISPSGSPSPSSTEYVDKFSNRNTIYTEKLEDKGTIYSDKYSDTNTVYSEKHQSNKVDFADKFTKRDTNWENKY